MAWIEPKTDWTKDDYFNYGDYNRIIGNIKFLKDYLDGLFSNLPNVDLGSDKTVQSNIYAREINAIETALENLNLKTYNLSIGRKTTYYPNKATPLYTEFNRIESATLLLYDTMYAHKGAMTRLSFKLGNQKGIRV